MNQVFNSDPDSGRLTQLVDSGEVVVVVGSWLSSPPCM